MRRTRHQGRSPTSLIAQELRTIYVPETRLPFEIDAALRALDRLGPTVTDSAVQTKKVA